jgi:GT2 family glycosyltransferase
MKPLTIILVTHNRLEYTKRTLKSLYDTVPFAKLIVVDNDSGEPGMKDYLLRLLEKELPFTNMKIHCLTKNVGWGEAVNEGLALHHDDEMILISNNDVVYKTGWYDTCLDLYDNYANIGILGVWRHTAHGIREDFGDMLVMDNVPAVGWLMRDWIIEKVGDFPVHGPCATKGGNGEDTAYVHRTLDAGYLVCVPKKDVAIHIDGY